MESELLLLMLFSFRVFKLVIPEEIQMCCNFKITLLRWSFSLRFPWPGRVFPYSAQVHQASTHLNSCDFSFLFFFPTPCAFFFSVSQCLRIEPADWWPLVLKTGHRGGQSPSPLPLYITRIGIARPTPAKKRMVHRHRLPPWDPQSDPHGY